MKLESNIESKSSINIHFRSRLHVIVLKHVWDQLFTVDTIWNIGETGDINT